MFYLFIFRDFDVKLYVCNEAFGFLEFSVVTRLTSHLTFPPYVIVHVVGMVTLLVAFFQSARCVQIVFFGNLVLF